MALEQKYDLLPSMYADELGTQYSSSVAKEHKKKLGQYFTPREVAKYMASFYLPSETNKQIRILDPGCGLGVLSCALCERLINFRHIRKIELVVFETDLELIDMAKKVFCYLQEWLTNKGVQFSYFLCANDFIVHNTSILIGEKSPSKVFDIAIANPPYFKVAKNDSLNKIIKTILYGQQNIYSIFIFLTVKFLAPAGVLIFISPRSFTSGNYFRAFREFAFQQLKIESLHLFHSRTKVFRKDKVLQENIIVSAKKRNIILNDETERPIHLDEITVSMSKGIEDIEHKRSKKYLISDLVNLNSYQKIFHIPTSRREEKVIDVFNTWTNSFSKSNIKISTGPVVSFRAKDFIVNDKKNNAVPLIWLNNITKMRLTWPISSISEERPQYFVNTPESKALLVNSQNMVIIRRFSSKDDASRLIATPFFKKDYEYDRIALENHVNYVYGRDEPLSALCVWGIAALLNSTLFDIYFRTFNGNINVSATELRELPLPEMDIIFKLGTAVKKTKVINQQKLDEIVSRIFKLAD
jgi:adenine-specific DNA-methyltransferase